MRRPPRRPRKREQGEELMGTIVSSLVVIAVGAILRFAVTESGWGIELSVVGVVLMIVGAIGLVLGIYFKVRNPYRGTYAR